MQGDRSDNEAQWKILRIFQRRRVRTAFRKYVSPQTIAKILRETGSEMAKFEVKHFQFVAVLPDDTKPQDIPTIIGKVMDVLIPHHANVSHSMPSLFVALLAVAGPFVCRCLIIRTMLRFHIPLIEPDVRIVRIRLSEKVSRCRPREIARPLGKADETEHIVQGGFRISFGPPSSPCVGLRCRDFPFSADSSRWRDDVLRFLAQTSSVVVRCQPWFYLRLEAYSFFWLSERAYG
jgi:hypothetical protein